jgi:hypothetical protein
VADAPKKKNTQGVLVRPTTGDTVTAWLALHPQPGSYLAISSQPHVLYQGIFLKRALPDTFNGETIGYASERQKMVVYADSFARALHNEYWYITNVPV